MDDTETMLLAAIRAAPADVAPRLAYLDHLAETGRPSRLPRDRVDYLLGQTLARCFRDGDTVEFHTAGGERFSLEHRQECCESVELVDVAGDLDDLVGSPLLMAEEASNSDDPPLYGPSPDSHTWTYYRFATARGYVTLRWFGSSNGYYSESVDFRRLP